jgi:hypothetical protein
MNAYQEMQLLQQLSKKARWFCCLAAFTNKKGGVPL